MFKSITGATPVKHYVNNYNSGGGIMDLNLELYLYPDVIVKVFCAITIIVLIAVVGKVTINSIKNGRKVAKKQNKEE